MRGINRQSAVEGSVEQQLEPCGTVTRSKGPCDGNPVRCHKHFQFGDAKKRAKKGSLEPSRQQLWSQGGVYGSGVWLLARPMHAVTTARTLETCGFIFYPFHFLVFSCLSHCARDRGK